MTMYLYLDTRHTCTHCRQGMRERGVSLDNYCLSSALPGIVLRAVDVLLTILGERDPYQAGLAHLEHTGTGH